MSKIHWLIWMFLVVALATVLRLYHIGVGSIAHPEVYAPGINLLPGISEPPPRHDFASVLYWHFHDEPHPIGYYLAMFGWTNMFGTTEFALRFPSAIFGVLSVLLTGILGARFFGRSVGVLAALLLALHGFHIYWSGIARMYVPGAFLGLLSTLVLIRIVQADRPRPWLEIGYVLVTFAGVQTVEFFWPFLALQIGWVTILAARDDAIASMRPTLKELWNGVRLAQLQSIALIVSAPALSHAVYRARREAAPDPELSFLQEYFSFGFLFAKDKFAMPTLEPSMLVASVALLAGLLLLFLVGRAKPVDTVTLPKGAPISPWLRIGLAVLASVFMLWLASIAHRRGNIMAVMAVLPIVATALPAVVAITARLLRRVRFLVSANPWLMLIILLAVVPVLVLFPASFKASVLAPRAFLIFLPYLIILMAASAWSLFRAPRYRWAAVGALVALFAASVPYGQKKPTSPNDYKTLAKLMQGQLLPDDLVFVRNRHWADTPLFYYLPQANYVTSDFDQALAAAADKRVWLVTWPYEGTPVISDERREALASYQPVMSLKALRAEAELFAPPKGTN